MFYARASNLRFLFARATHTPPPTRRALVFSNIEVSKNMPPSWAAAAAAAKSGAKAAAAAEAEDGGARRGQAEARGA